jgi:AcrR family transcriptional regulator
MRKTKEDVVEEFRRASIQDAAVRAIARKGIDDVTVQDIADEAGVATGTVYVYFGDREGLLASTADRLFDTLLGQLEPAFATEGSFAARLQTVVLAQLRFFDEHRALFRATHALAQREDDMTRSRSRCAGRYVSLLEQFFAEGAKGGAIRSGLDPKMLANVYRDCVRGLILRRLDPTSHKSRSSAEDDARLIVSILLRGIASGENE